MKKGEQIYARWWMLLVISSGSRQELNFLPIPVDVKKNINLWKIIRKKFTHTV